MSSISPIAHLDNAGQNQRDWLTPIFKQYERGLTFWTFQRTEDYALAEDVVQEAFLKLLTVNPTEFNSRMLFRWCKYFIYVSKVDHWSRLVRAGEHARNIRDGRPRPSDNAISAELLDAIDTLPARQARIVSLLVRDGLTYREIRTLVGLNVGAVREEFQAGISTLRNKFPEIQPRPPRPSLPKRRAKRQGTSRMLWCIGLDRAFKSTIEAAEYVGVSQPALSFAATHPGRTSGGYRWEWRDTPEVARREESLFTRFVAARIETDISATLTRAAVYADYLEWAAALGIEPSPRHALFGYLRRLSYVQESNWGRLERRFVGIKLQARTPRGN